MVCWVPDFGASSIDAYGRRMQKHNERQLDYVFDEEMSLANKIRE